MTNVNEGKLTITRRSEADGTTNMYIELEDSNAHITPVEIKISPELLMMALTGFSCQNCLFEVENIDKVGKIREQSSISFEVPTYDKAKAIEEAKKHTPEGWVADTYYGSQNSFKYLPNGGYLATTKILRWVDRTEQGKE